MKRLVLVDGNAVLHRAFHATPPLTTSKGELINASFGFTSMLLRSLEQLKPDYIAIAWDMRAPTFRHQAYTQYKATRAPMDDQLSGQYDRVHEIIKALNIPEFGVEGYEADDLVGTLARQAVEKEKNIEVIIITGDRDIMQVIDTRIKVLMPKKTLIDVGLYGIEEFVERFGFQPINLIDYKALAGDASDNIPGVPGVGEVTATKLVKEFTTIEKLYQQDNLKDLPERTQKLLAEGAESAAMSKTLATIDTKAPIKLDLSECVVHDYDHQKVLDLFQELEFKSLLNRLPGDQLTANSLPHTAKPNAAAVSGQRSAVSSVPLAQGSSSPQTIQLDLEVDKVLKKMTETGVLIDLKFLEKFGTQLKTRLTQLEKDIYATIGHEFNINSPKQLSEILFDELKLPVIRKTKTGRSTDEATLNELKASHPAIPHILEYRMLFKLISTYVDTLPKYADPNHRVHSTFNVEGAATGRLSSTNPNLQNIPNKGEEGAEIRKAFISPKGKVLLSADYSQIELRILAHVTGDPNLKKAFDEKLDIHSATASKIFNIPIDAVSKQQRMIGKTMNFATLYGQGPHALSQQLGVDYNTARAYIAEYFEQFPKVKDWMAKILTEAFDKGYVETIWGRRRYIPELQSPNRMFKSAGERAAINHPIQGTSADMIKKVMVEIDAALTADSLRQTARQTAATESGQRKAVSGPSCAMILQVHDELLFECDPKAVDDIAKMVCQKMEDSLTLSVPVIAEVKIGPNWGEMTPL